MLLPEKIVVCLNYCNLQDIIILKIINQEAEMQDSDYQNLLAMDINNRSGKHAGRAVIETYVGNDIPSNKTIGRVPFYGRLKVHGLNGQEATITFTPTGVEFYDRHHHRAAIHLGNGTGMFLMHMQRNHQGIDLGEVMPHLMNLAGVVMASPQDETYDHVSDYLQKCVPNGVFRPLRPTVDHVTKVGVASARGSLRGFGAS